MDHDGFQKSHLFNFFLKIPYIGKSLLRIHREKQFFSPSVILPVPPVTTVFISLPKLNEYH